MHGDHRERRRETFKTNKNETEFSTTHIPVWSGLHIPTCMLNFVTEQSRHPILGDPGLNYRGGRKVKWMKPVQAKEMKL